jgi:hypothetical protein
MCAEHSLREEKSNTSALYTPQPPRMGVFMSYKNMYNYKNNNSYIATHQSQVSK